LDKNGLQTNERKALQDESIGTSITVSAGIASLGSAKKEPEERSNETLD
jgi:hypothetical protein